jgi:hypothetical protein
MAKGKNAAKRFFYRHRKRWQTLANKRQAEEIVNTYLDSLTFLEKLKFLFTNKRKPL